MPEEERTAIRNPKRGKAHRTATVAYASALQPVNSTVCGRWARDMTESIPVERTAPEDRCKTCWPTPEGDL